MCRLIGAVDIGGTKILAGIVDEAGHVLCEDYVQTPVGKGGAEQASQIIAGLLHELTRSIGVDIMNLEGVGIVCAGPVDSSKGIVENPYTLPGWNGFPLARRLTELTRRIVKIENDVNGAVLGEVFLNRLDGNRVLMIAFGTGIGVAACNCGKLYTTGGRYHPEMGHTIVADEGPECYCRHRGCFESLWSGAAINRRAIEMGYESFDDLFLNMKSGEQKSVNFMNHASRQLSNGIWNLLTVFNPDVLILGGGFMNKYYDYAYEIIRKDIDGLPDFVENLRVMKANTANNSALVGASILIYQGK